jgi:hypothetical protein
MQTSEKGQKGEGAYVLPQHRHVLHHPPFHTHAAWQNRQNPVNLMITMLCVAKLHVNSQIQSLNP